MGLVPAVVQTVKICSETQVGHDAKTSSKRTKEQYKNCQKNNTLRRRLGPVNQTDTPGPFRAELTAPGETKPPHDRSSLMCTRSEPSPWLLYKDDFAKLNVYRVIFAFDADSIIVEATLSFNGFYSIEGVE